MQTQQLNGAPFNQLSSFVQFQTQLPNRSYHKIKSSLKITFSNCLQPKEDNFYLLPKNPPYKNVLFNKDPNFHNISTSTMNLLSGFSSIFQNLICFTREKLEKKRYTHKTKSNPIQSDPISEGKKPYWVSSHRTDQTMACGRSTKGPKKLRTLGTQFTPMSTQHPEL